MRFKLVTPMIFAVLVGSVLTAQPASAVQKGTITIQAVMSVNPGLTYPGVSTSRSCDYTIYGKATTKGMPPFKVKQDVNLGRTPSCTEANWHLATANCVDTHTTAGKAGEAPASAGGCYLSASGTLNGWCGMSSGTGTGTFVDSAGKSHPFRITWGSVGTVEVFSGELYRNGQRGPLEGMGRFSPSVSGCATASGTSFFDVTVHLEYCETIAVG